MSTTGFNAKQFDSLVKGLADRFGAPEPLPLSPGDQFVWSFLLWEASLADAERAYKKLSQSFLDVNELRVSLVEEIVESIGVRYPMAEERSRRLRDSLHEVFLREHAVSFDGLKDMPKRGAKQYLDGISHAPPFVTGRVMLLALGGHAAPIDDRMLDLLKDEGVFEEEIDLSGAIAILERHVKAANAVETHLLLLSACEDQGGRRGRARGAKKAAKRPAAKRAAGRKTESAPKAKKG